MAKDTLNATAKAITALANAMERGDEKSLLKIDFYYEEFERAAKANYWSPARQLELACTYIKDNAQE
ncbi:22935_t:CDS:2, partial [Gigaspora margarita]